MYAPERHDSIRALIERDGRASVSALSQRFGVTAETVRRDLDELERRGLVRRVHGGAVAPAHTSIAEPTLVERMDRARDAKQRIARAAIAMLPATFTGSIVLDAGTTTGALASLLAAWRPAAPAQRLAVITGAVPVAAVLVANPHLDIHLLGGQLRGSTGAAVGPATLQQLELLRPDIAFVGANGVSAEFGLSTPDPAEAAVKAAMVRAARRTVALVDASKLGEETLVRFARLSEIDTLVCDADPPGVLSAALDGDDVEVIVA